MILCFHYILLILIQSASCSYASSELMQKNSGNRRLCSFLGYCQPCNLNQRSEDEIQHSGTWVCVVFCMILSHFSWTSIFWIFLDIFTPHLACTSLITCTLEEVELSAYNGDVWLHCGEHLLWGTGWIQKFKPLLSRTPLPNFKNSGLSIQIKSENVMNNCFIILYKHRG